ncbi:hypothetical protein PFISCL1PPCAC_23203 [Pristionchus fissidentatus]|uniref:Uncharacterized protein n=1 Tax=Pristionchus fissidentatus TaxID=1538716 RepID=A0AAV5WI02_9BILA|nr:hypothetical protein PFISCL1PPCAC_23203 [Pristionchus fissidentatus]
MAATQPVMNEDDLASLPEDLRNFNVPGVPTWSTFDESDEERERRATAFFASINDREAVQRDAAAETEGDENATPAGPRFKVPDVPPSRSRRSRIEEPQQPQSASGPTSSTTTAVATDDDANLGALAAFNGPRPPMRRSRLLSSSSSQVGALPSLSTPSASQQVQPLQQQQQPIRQMTAGAASAAAAAQRRRSRSISGQSSANEPVRSRQGSVPARSALPAVPRVARTGSLTRPATAPGGTPGVQTRAMAAAAAAGGGETAAAAAPTDEAVAALTDGVAGLAVGGGAAAAAAGGLTQQSQLQRRASAAAASSQRQSRDTTRRPIAVGPAAGGRAAPATSAIHPTRGMSLSAIARRAIPAAASSRAAPVRVGAPLRAADGALAALPRTQSAFNAPLQRSATSRSTPTAAAGEGAAASPARAAPTPPRRAPAPGGSAARVQRPLSTTRRVPTPQSIDRLSAPRANRGGAATPQRPFVSHLRNYPRDTRPPPDFVLATIPNTPHFRVDQRALEPRNSGGPAAGTASPARPLAPRPRPPTADAINRLSAPRLGAVPVGRTHGLPVVGRQATSSFARPTRSGSVPRVAAGSGGVVGAARGLRGGRTGRSEGPAQQ